MAHYLQPYISLYEQEQSTLNAAGAQALAARRQSARNALLQHIAHRPDALLADVLAPDYGLNLHRHPMNIDPQRTFGCDVPRIGNAPCYTFNDVVHCPDADGLPHGVSVTAMAQARGNDADTLRRYVGTLTDFANDTIAALAALLAQDGVLIHIAEGVTTDRPIQLVNILNSVMPLMAVRHVLVVAERRAHVQLLLCDHTQTTDAPVLSCEVVEVVVGPQATVEVYDLEENNASTRRLRSFYARQSADSRLLVVGSTLSCGTTRNTFRLDVDQQGADTQIYGMAIADNNQQIENHTLLRHRAPQCTSNEMFKYVLQDHARGVFEGRILVQPDCPGVEAYQGNRNLLAGPDARMHTRPQLEIYTDDVKCGHGSTIGQLDEEALFYMRTRGVPLPQARTLLMQAFMADVASAVRPEALQQRLRMLVDRRFAGQLATCATCPAHCNN